MSDKILVVEDEEILRFTFENFLSDEGYEVSTAQSYEQALERIDESDFHLIISDIVLGEKNGIDFLKEMRQRALDCPVVMITGYPNVETASEAVRLGAFDYLSKPVEQETLLRVAKTALYHKALIDEKEQYRLHLEAVFNSVHEGIVTVDKDLHIIEINKACEKICKVSQTCKGKPFSTLLESCGGKCYDALVETIEKKKSVEISRYECQLNSGPKKILSLTTSPLINNRDIFSGAILVTRDETSVAELERVLGQRRQFHNIIGKSKKMQEVYSLIENLANVETTVLIRGESGTGKELTAEALYFSGERKKFPFVKVNCSALSDNLLESELFGHVKGAFTGAYKDKIGRFQKAHKGTIFLDEIGDISKSMQLNLLRVLQEKEFERVGDSHPIKVDVRVVAATNQNLEEKVKQKLFRQDLYYRLKVVEIILPPLRQKTEDIPLLVNYFIKKFNEKFNKQINKGC